MADTFGEEEEVNDGSNAIDTTKNYPSAKEVATFHRNSDRDKSQHAIHHTLGSGRYQAARGDHVHDGDSGTALLDTATYSGNVNDLFELGEAVQSLSGSLADSLGATDSTSRSGSTTNKTPRVTIDSLRSLLETGGGGSGPKGDTGAPGADSTVPGPKGDKGDKGNTGPIGPEGPTGPRGFKGDQGIQGPKGDTGARGYAGSNGSDGTNGTDGQDGAKGDQGIQGETGPKGSKGDQGIQGIQGEQGVKGDQGIQGKTGPAGLNGTNGTDGEDSTVPGPKGDKGNKGDQGTGLNLETSVANEAALPSTGNTAGDGRITNDTGHLWTWDGTQWNNAGLIQGPEGDQGIQGEQGIQGPKGNTGAKGAKGDQGPQGIQGIQGPKGNDGTNGTDGVDGDTGPKGDTGAKGNKGNDGGEASLVNSWDDTINSGIYYSVAYNSGGPNYFVKYSGIVVNVGLGYVTQVLTTADTDNPQVLSRVSSTNGNTWGDWSILINEEDTGWDSIPLRAGINAFSTPPAWRKKIGALYLRGGISSAGLGNNSTTVVATMPYMMRPDTDSFVNAPGSSPGKDGTWVFRVNGQLQIKTGPSTPGFFLMDGIAFNSDH